MKKKMYSLEVFYLGPIDMDKDKEIKSFVENLLKDGFECNAKWSYQESTYGETPFRWIGWDIDKRLYQDEKTRIVLAIDTFLEGVRVSEI